MTDIRKWYGNGGRFVSWRMVYAPDDLETGPRQCQHAQRCPGPAAAQGRLLHHGRLQGGLVRHPHRGAHQGELQPRREPGGRAVVARRGHIRLHLTWSMDDPPQRTLCYVNETDTRAAVVWRSFAGAPDRYTTMAVAGGTGGAATPTYHPTAGEAMSTAWRYVTDHKPAPQGRE